MSVCMVPYDELVYNAGCVFLPRTKVSHHMIHRNPD